MRVLICCSGGLSITTCRLSSKQLYCSSLGLPSTGVIFFNGGYDLRLMYELPCMKFSLGLTCRKVCTYFASSLGPSTLRLIPCILDVSFARISNRFDFQCFKPVCHHCPIICSLLSWLVRYSRDPRVFSLWVDPDAYLSANPTTYCCSLFLTL